MKGLKVFEDHITSNTKTEQTKDAEHRKTKSLFLKSIVKKSVLIRIGLEIETKIHFFLHCPLFQSARQSLLMNIKKTGESILKKHGEFITKTLCMAMINLGCLVISLQYFQQLNSSFLLKDLVIH